jgi:hypothetical protein
MAILSLPLSYVFSSYSSPQKIKKAIKFPLWLLENKKAMGSLGSPMAFHPDIGIEFTGAPLQNKNKRSKS